MSVFVTGTDTGVGKTSFTTWLLREFHRHGGSCAGYKPICCGDRDDAIQLQTAGDPNLTLDEVNPVWLRTPAAPLTATRAEKRTIDLTALRAGFDRLIARVDFVAVEGVGGWMVPITSDYLSNHLAADLALPVIVIARNRLGCLNHVLLTVRAIEADGLTCAGVVLNDFGEEADLAMTTNFEILQRCLTAPVFSGFGSDFAQFGQIIPEIRQLLSPR